MTVGTRIQLRRDSAGAWTAANPVLASGEQGIETDTQRLKRGDGVTAWNALPYVFDNVAASVAFQPLSTDLTTIAGLSSATAGALGTDGSGWVRKTYAQLKTALGLVKADVGLGSADNTSDASKPVSTAQQAALNAKLDISAANATFRPVASGTAPTDARPEWLSSSVRNLRVSSSAADRALTLSPTIAWEQTAVQEPNVFFANGVWNLIFTGGTSSTAIGLATAPTRSGPWTHNAAPIIGAGHGGVAGEAVHGNVYVEGSTAYCYFTDGANTTLYLATAATSNLSSWTLSGTTWALPAGCTLWGNTGILKEADNTYTMFFECFRSGDTWLIGVGTLGASLTGALTVQTSVVSSLRIGSAASSSGPLPFRDSTGYVLYFHAAMYGSLPTDVYRATSTDKVTWVIDNDARPIIARANAREVDQVADVQVVQTSAGDFWAFWAAFDNPGIKAYIHSAPMLPTAMRYDADSASYVRAGEPSATRAENDYATKPQISVLAADLTTTSTSYADAGLTVDFIPLSTRAIVRVFVVASNSGGGNVTFFAVRCPNTGVTKTLGNTSTPSGGYQVPFSQAAVFTGLTPGAVHQFDLRWKVSAGTANCRAAAFPEQEMATLLAEDAGAPFGPNND